MDFLEGGRTGAVFVPYDEGTRTRKCRKAPDKFAANHHLTETFCQLFFFFLPASALRSKLVNKVGEKRKEARLIWF